MLDAVIDHIATRGISDLSLRELAAAIGTSHRMLIHHFGGAEGLLRRGRPRRWRSASATRSPTSCPTPRCRSPRRCACGGGTSPTSRCGRTSGCSSSSTARRSRAGPGTTELLDGIVDAWVEPAAQILAAHGFDEPHAVARLGIAVTRGLLLDLLATGDRAAVDAAMEVHITSLTRAG